MSENFDKADNKPVTVKQMIQWGTIIGALVTTVVSVIWFWAGIKEEQALQRDDINQIRQQVTDVKSQANSTDRDVTELNRKLDVATTILQRIDTKLQHP